MESLELIAQVFLVTFWQHSLSDSIKLFLLCTGVSQL